MPKVVHLIKFTSKVIKILKLTLVFRSSQESSQKLKNTTGMPKLTVLSNRDYCSRICDKFVNTHQFIILSQ